MGKAELKVEIDADLLAQAREAGLSIDDLLEDGLRAALKGTDADARARRWAEDNADEIADYNRRIAARGLFGDEFRKW